MFIELLFATTLDMSLPEFQPMEDISGNVIVSEINDVSGDIIAAEIPLDEIPLEETSERSLQGLSLETEPTEQIMLRAIETHTVDASIKSNYRVNNSLIGYHSGDNLYYVYLTADIEYTISTISGIYTTLSLNKDSVATSYHSSTITPSQNMYLVKNNSSFYVTYTTGEPDPEPDISGNEPGGDVSGDDVSGDDVSGDSPGGDISGGDNPSIEVDLSTVENKIDKLIVLGRSLLFVLIVQFCYPLIISIFNNIGGGRDV